MKIKLTEEMIEKHANLIKDASTRIDPNTGYEIHIAMKSCYELIAEIYGFNSYDDLCLKIKENK